MDKGMKRNDKRISVGSEDWDLLREELAVRWCMKRGPVGR
jgi:hypothetical protein